MDLSSTYNWIGESNKGLERESRRGLRRSSSGFQAGEGEWQANGTVIGRPALILLDRLADESFIELQFVRDLLVVHRLELVESMVGLPRLCQPCSGRLA